MRLVMKSGAKPPGKNLKIQLKKSQKECGFGQNRSGRFRFYRSRG
jgi:hypothetical protein